MADPGIVFADPKIVIADPKIVIADPKIVIADLIRNPCPRAKATPASVSKT